MFVRTLILVIAANVLSGCATMNAVDIGDRWTWPTKFESVELIGDRMAVRYTAMVRSRGTRSRIVNQDAIYVGELNFGNLVWTPLSERPGVCRMPVRALSEAEDRSVGRQATLADQRVVIVPVSYAPSKDNYVIDPEHVRRAYSDGGLDTAPFTAYAAERRNQLTLVRVGEDGRTLEWVAVIPGQGTGYTEPWAYPVRAVAVPVAVILDIVTFPIQVLVAVHELSNF